MYPASGVHSLSPENQIDPIQVAQQIYEKALTPELGNNKPRGSERDVWTIDSARDHDGCGEWTHSMGHARLGGKFGKTRASSRTPNINVGFALGAAGATPSV